MDSTTSFRGTNYGTQIGNSYAPVTNEFYLSWDLDDKLSPVSEAAFDSYVDQHEDQCLPGTRTDLLSQISEWASSPQGRCIFWLNGIAGTGKSTISRTMAKSFSLLQSLGASFFFKRGEGDRGNAKRLFPTIARQLAITVPEFAPVLQEIVRENPGVITKTMREQFEKLLLQPLRSLKQSESHSQAIRSHSMVIVIDALDECEGDGDIRLILQLLPQLQNLATTRLRVLLTSRPDLPVRLGFSKITEDTHREFVLHNIPHEVIERDIALFFDHRLTEIRSARILPSGWPGDEGLQKLVALSVPLFIFAATICRIFEEPDWDPIDSLNDVLTGQNDQSKLDSTYLPVLDRLLSRQHRSQKGKLVSEFQQVIGAIVTLESPLSVPSLARLLDLPERLIRLRLDPLHSVLRIPENETIPVRLFHLSFQDFLLDPETLEKTPLGVNETEAHCMLATKCLLLCQQSLQKNICGLPSDGTERTEIDRQTVHSSLPPELQYACRYWAYHLVKCANSEHMISSALSLLKGKFLQEHLLHWVEAMSLLGLTSEILGILDQLQAIKSGNDSSLASGFLHDAKRFVLKNHQVIDLAPLQVYCAGLVFVPQTAIIRAQFEGDIPNWIDKFPRVEERWGPELQTLEGHSDSVMSVAFSPNGSLLASGSYDETVRLWDPITGTLIQTLKGHSGPVTSVAFPPDGSLLASGSRDTEVLLWDPATGALIQKLEGHSSPIKSIAFSPDGRLLASGSLDRTVRLWDLTTGVLIQTLKGHYSHVDSVAFSPDGRLLASGSEDKTVRLWGPVTGILIQTLEGHSGPVTSVAFSPDGSLLVSGSYDKTVGLWDPITGTFINIFKGHLVPIWSVAFSPDGCLLASGSTDKTIQLWDIATGSLIQKLKGHQDIVISLIFSPDSRLLISGSYDETVRLWDLVTADTLTQTLEGHAQSVKSVAFSPNGRLLSSIAYADDIIHLWDPTTGMLTKTLKGHSYSVKSVAFSPDSRLLASGCSDGTVRLWDLATGAVIQTFKDHLHVRPVRSVAFSPDGRLLASGSDDTRVRLWDPVTGVRTHTLQGHSGIVHSVAFSSDSRLLASGSSGDGTVRLWDPVRGVPTRTWNIEKLGTSLELSHDGFHLHTDVGILDIQPIGDIHIPQTPHVDIGISFEQSQWITLNGEKILWLPIEFRPTFLRSFAVSGNNTLAIGHESGKVSFIGFSI